MITGIVRNLLVLAALIGLGGCVSNGGGALPDPLVSASEFESMIEVTVVPIAPEPVDGVTVAAVDQDHIRLQAP